MEGDEMYTKGEWTIEHTMNGFRIQQFDKIICWEYQSGYHCLPIKESEANAHLISASPDLLEACEMALKLLEDNQDETQWYLKGHYNKLQQAISKAKGEV